MDSRTFDAFARALGLGDLGSRRTLLGLSLGGVLGALGLGLSEHDAEGKNKKKRRRRRKKKRRKKKRKTNKQQPVFNEFGCVDVGNFCQNSDQCCSDICEGQACQAHDQLNCTAGDLSFQCGAEQSEPCFPSSGGVGSCDTTTGNAGYCGSDDSLNCFACNKDADCQPFCGPQAACIVCEGDCEEIGTACVSTGADDCEFPPT